MGTPNPGGGLDLSGGSSPPVGLLGPPRVVAIPPAPSIDSLSASPSAGQASIVVPLPSTGAGQGASAPAIAGSSGNRQAILGPLPLSGSTPDGGIFAYPYGQARGQTNPIRETLTIEQSPETGDAPGSSETRLLVGERGSAVDDLESSRPSIARDFESEMQGSPLSTGAVILPSMAAIAEIRIPRASSGEVASRAPAPHDRSRPRTSVVALMLGSAGLFFGLIAPDCVTRLTAWQDDRRWRRKVSWKRG